MTSISVIEQFKDFPILIIIGVTFIVGVLILIIKYLNKKTIAPHSNSASQLFLKEKEHNISLKDNSLELSQISDKSETSLNNNIKRNSRRGLLKLRNFNYMFFVILICLSFAMLYGGWSYLKAKEIILDNQNYEYIDQNQERQFNEWDLDRMYKFHFAFGSFFFFLVLVYLFMCIKWKNAPPETQGVQK